MHLLIFIVLGRVVVVNPFLAVAILVVVVVVLLLSVVVALTISSS
jgi:hypothetical protein